MEKLGRRTSGRKPWEYRGYLCTRKRVRTLDTESKSCILDIAYYMLRTSNEHSTVVMDINETNCLL